MSQLVLVEGGQSRCRVVLTEQSPAGRYAADELVRHLRQISGAAVPIAGAADAEGSPDGPTIHLGRSPRVDRLMAGFDWPSLGEDGCVVRRVDDAVVLAGNSPRATLYAVYELLDREFGCRWLTPDHAHIPRRDRIGIGSLDTVHVPKMKMRDMLFASAGDATWAARNRCNGSFSPLEAKHGGARRFAGPFVHSFYALVPPDDYFDEHPEYFSLIDGERVREAAQICLTDDDVLRIVCDRLRRWLVAEPGARAVSVSQNDWNGACQCGRCRAIVEQEGSESGPVIRFVNAVAERLEREFPHVLFTTLAYTYSVDAPKHVRPRRNVGIYLCHMGGCDAHPITACESNRWFDRLLDQWCAISPEVFIWDYCNNFWHYFMPYPNLDGLVADIPLMAERGVTGYFAQGDSTPSKGPGDMAELRAYLIARLMWRPDLDGREVIDEFLDLYYGPVAEPIHEYLELMHDQVRPPDRHVMLYDPPTKPHLDDHVLDRADAIFERAIESVTGDEALRRRVETARLPIDYMRWTRGLRMRVAGDRYTPEPGPALDRARRFFRLAVEQGAQGMAEGGDDIEQAAVCLEGYDVVALEHGPLRLVVAPLLGGRILSFSDLRSGIEWLHRPRAGEVGFPNCGGYDEYSQARWHTPGWVEPYACERRDGGVQLTAELANGLHFERTYRLCEADGRPRLEIISTLRNISGDRAAAIVRAHPEYAADDRDTTRVELRGPGGSWTATPPGDTHVLEGESIPAGAWRLVRGAEALTSEFDREHVSKALIEFAPEQQLVRLELFGVQRYLAHGESVTLQQAWTPLPVR